MVYFCSLRRLYYYFSTIIYLLPEICQYLLFEILHNLGFQPPRPVSHRPVKPQLRPQTCQADKKHSSDQCRKHGHAEKPGRNGCCQEAEQADDVSRTARLPLDSLKPLVMLLDVECPQPFLIPQSPDIYHDPADSDGSPGKEQPALKASHKAGLMLIHSQPHGADAADHDDHAGKNDSCSHPDDLPF